MNSIHLSGAEDVRSAGASMREAASTMQSAAGNFQYAVDDLKRFMEDWLMRFQITLQESKEDYEKRISNLEANAHEPVTFIEDEKGFLKVERK